MINRTLLSAALGTALLGAGSVAQATEMNAETQAFYTETVYPLITSAAVLDAVAAQNAQTHGYTADDIAALDRQWAAEIGRADAELINSVTGSALSAQLREMIEGSNGIYTEIFLMDAQGLNVASSGVTSDYWQGDEAKFQESFGAGADAFHLSEVEFDESAQAYSVQVSFPINDPATGEPIGAITFGVDATVLQ
ncbi:PDC sensor domain-containing protein [Pseudoroseicyclus sp. CXY001]|uniref:PDC sensor domain-containing protein n=1 Tax=Pseudoroseicyclus sp. CXY001 TaxID=3242492 RepID=UPI00358DA90B